MLQNKLRSIFVLAVMTFAGLVALHPTASARADAAWHIVFNGLPSEMAIQTTETSRMVPVSFPVPPEGQRQEYRVLVESDPTAMAVKVTRIRKSAPVRGPGDCRWCNGSKKCQDCWPAGSKVNTGGLPCIGCDATGACNFCNGSGVCWTCDGRGFNTGCPDCAKFVSKE